MADKVTMAADNSILALSSGDKTAKGALLTLVEVVFVLEGGRNATMSTSFVSDAKRRPISSLRLFSSRLHRSASICCNSF